jgi:transaldolase
MKLYLDTANLEEIRAIKRWGVLGGCTTNPSLLAKEHADWEVQMKVVKVAMTPEGLEAGKRLIDQGIPVNVTLTFSPAQAILAAEIGATYVSPFIGRIDDVGADGMYALREICEIFEVQGYDTLVLAASLRHPMHVVEAARAGADVATMPFSVFSQLVKHPLTDIGLEKFLSDWKRLQQELKEGA